VRACVQTGKKTKEREGVLMCIAGRAPKGEVDACMRAHA